MKKAKLLALASLVLACILVLGACGSSATSAPASTAPADSSATSTAAPESTGGGDVKLVYWSMWNNTEPQGQTLEAGIKDFMDKNPGVTVEINWAGRETRQTLAPAIDNGQQVDIFDEDIQRVNENWTKYLLPLDSYYDQTYPTTGGKPYKDSVMAALQTLSRSYSDGKLYTVGYQPFAFVFMYNKDHFADAGIAAPPKTWDEFVDACQKLKDKGYAPLTTDNEYVSGLLGYHLARMKGKDFATQLVNDTTGAMWDDPAVLEAAKAYEDLAKKGFFDKNAGGNIWPVGQQDVAAGTVSMYLNGTWLVNEIMGTTGPDFPWGTFNYPTVPGGLTGLESANYGSQVFAINKDCKNPDVAFQLLVHLTTGEWDATLAQNSFGVPVGGTTDWPVQLSEAKIVFDSLTVCYPWVGGIEGNTDKGPVVRENAQKLVGGTITAEQFVENCKK